MVETIRLTGKKKKETSAERRAREARVKQRFEAAKRGEAQKKEGIKQAERKGEKREEPEVIQLTEKKEKKKFASVKEQIKRSAELPIGDPRSLKTTAILGATLAAVSGAAFLQAALAKSAATGGSLIGKFVNVDVIGKGLGLTSKQTAALAKEVGRRRISQIANTITNPKTTGLLNNILKKVFSGKALALMGGAASTLFLGKWGQAEAGEPISIVMKDVLREAEKTGDYTLYDEAAAARDELTNLSTWETILSNTPFISPFIGIPNKIKGVKQAGAIMDELRNQQQIAAEAGESEEEKWARIDREREERRERERIENEQYYTKVTEDLKEAKKAERREEERYWAKVLKEREAAEKAKREADEKYWADVRRANSELKEQENRAFQEYAGSNLNFGLL